MIGENTYLLGRVCGDTSNASLASGAAEIDHFGGTPHTEEGVVPLPEMRVVSLVKSRQFASTGEP